MCRNSPDNPDIRERRALFDAAQASVQQNVANTMAKPIQP